MITFIPFQTLPTCVRTPLKLCRCFYVLYGVGHTWFFAGLKGMVWPGVCSGYWENIFVCKNYKKRILISSIWFNCLKWIQMHFIEKCNEKRNSNINIHCALDVEEAAWHFNLATQLLKTPRKIVCSKLLEAAFSILEIYLYDLLWNKVRNVYVNVIHIYFPFFLIFGV